MKFDLVWFDSMGAKSSCVSVETEDVRILIDPGIAAMQPSFPAPNYKKILWREQGRKRIKRFAKRADVIIISHYHYDHYLPNDIDIYRNKTIFAKNPNLYINESQRERAFTFYQKIWKEILHADLRLEESREKKFRDPAEKLASMKMDFGDYNERREELMEKGRKWFERLSSKWQRWGWIDEINDERIKVIYPEDRRFRFGSTIIRFSAPLFHGVEYSRVGWVFMTVIEHNDFKLLHSSDLNGPIIEDYAEMIIRENPDVIILDGPMTYMFGYLLNRTNLNRAIGNAKRIVEEVDFDIMIYDHHLPREPRFRDRTRDVWETAKRLEKRVLTASEYIGEPPKVLSP